MHEDSQALSPEGLSKQLSLLILWINQQGWSPATSTNYSFRHPDKDDYCFVSRSGVDKSKFNEDDFIGMNLEGKADPYYKAMKPSAETAIHLTLYKHLDCNVVLHTHSKADTLISRISAPWKQVEIEKYELLKGLRGKETHETSTIVPIFENNQNIEKLSQDILFYLNNYPETQGVLIESHGFYTWGRSLEEAKRHLEVFQFLFDCELSMKLLRD